MYQAMIIGNLCHEPDLRQTQGGQAICKLRIAVDTEKKDAVTPFVTVEVWGRRGEWAGEYLGKGAKVCCVGAMYLDEWEVTRGDDAGKMRQELRMNADRVSAFGDWKPKAGHTSAPTEDADLPIDRDGLKDDIPF